MSAASREPVAQIGNLLCRRLAIGRASVHLAGSMFCGLSARDTADYQSALQSRRAHMSKLSRARVGQIGNLLCRGLAIGRASMRLAGPTFCGLSARDTADYQSALR